MAHIAVLEGYGRHRRRRRRHRSYGSLGRHRRRHVRRKSGGRAKFSRAAKACSRIVRRSGGSFRACMRRHLKKRR